MLTKRHMKTYKFSQRNQGSCAENINTVLLNTITVTQLHEKLTESVNYKRAIITHRITGLFD